MHAKLYMILLGCTPKGRNTEQHDIFFGIGNSLSSLKPAMQQFWPGTHLHIDAWREVTNVDGFAVKIIPEKDNKENRKNNLFFLNLGGYKPNEFEEFHYKMIIIADTQGDAVKLALKTAFYKHTSMPVPATSHIDDRYGIDVDDFFAIRDILPADMKKQFSIAISSKPVVGLAADELHLGYLKWTDLVY